MASLPLLDQPQAASYVLQNPLGQYSLWPQISAVPEGWRPIFGPQPQTACLDWLEMHWPDIRPTCF